MEPVDSGIFIRGENPQNPQIQIGISGSLNRDMTASPYVPKQGYPIEALKNHGLAKGVALSTKRVCKCHPWSEGGIDEVPRK